MRAEIDRADIRLTAATSSEHRTALRESQHRELLESQREAVSHSALMLSRAEVADEDENLDEC